MNSSGEVQQPQFEALPPQENIPQSAELTSDQALESGAPDEQRVGKQQPPPTAVAPLALPPVTDDQPSVFAEPDAGSNISPEDRSADHSHINEKQWVDKAKAIVAQTQDDPYTQKKEISKVKADFIQKRFNKTIPTDKSVPA